MTEQQPTHRGGGHQTVWHGGHGGHGLMMIACCIPMIVIAITLVATGVASPGFLFGAVACMAMMALMMRATAAGPPVTTPSGPSTPVTADNGAA